MKKKLNQSQIQEYIYRKPEPNFAIKLEQIEDQAKHTFICECEMCNLYHGKKALEILNKKTDEVNKKVKEKLQNGNLNSQHYFQVLRRLILPIHKIVKRGVDIFIPEVCFFQEGQTKALFMNRQLNDCTIKKVFKSNLNLGVLQRILNERRRQYREDMKKNLGIGVKRQYVRKQSGINVGGRKQSQPASQVRQFKGTVVIKYKDGYQSMISQHEFIMMTLRRKLDPIWREIDYIRNNISVADEVNNIFIVEYERGNIKYLNLMQRAKILVKIYGENIIPFQQKYISPSEQMEFSLQIIKKNKKTFVQYLLYKMVCFIEYFQDEEVVEMSCKILLNEVYKPFLIDCMSFKKLDKMKFTWTNQTYRRKLDQQEKKFFENKNQHVNRILGEKPQIVYDLMEQNYVDLRNKVGVSLEDSENEEEQKNDRFWNKVHPEFNGRQLSEILATQKNMTVDEFRRKYLGFKEERKPIVKQFSTQMIKVLHRTTPKLKVSEFHEVSTKPNDSGFLSSRTHKISLFAKRSSLSMLTTYTKGDSRHNSVQIPQKVRKNQRIDRSKTPSQFISKKKRRSSHFLIKPHEFSFTKDFLQDNK